MLWRGSNGCATPRNRAVDGIVGPYTILGVQKALQNAGYYKGYALDGDFGVQTKKAWQTYLSKHL